MTEFEKGIYNQIAADHDYVVGLRRYFHMHPELGGEEVGTHKRIMEELRKIGLEPREIAETGVIAEIEGAKTAGGEGRCIALRADIDALPIAERSGVQYKSLTEGRMHACGHDSHTASLIGAARILAKNRDKFSGRVIVTFQPGEEIGYGGRVIAQSGGIDAAGRTFGLHVASNVPVGKVVLMAGPNNAGVDWFRIRIHGLGSHVSTPEQGVDALYIASQIVVTLQSIVTRRTSPMEPVLIGVGRLTAGTAYNVVAQEAELEGTIRTFTPEVRRRTAEELERLVMSTAELYGATAEIEWHDNGAPLINDLEATLEARRTAVSLFGRENVIENRVASLSGDDFAEYILRVPGVYAYIGTANEADPNTRVAIHNDHFDIDESSMLLGTAMYTLYTMEYLNGEV